MRLREYANKLNITYQTALKHYKEGIIKGAYQIPTGTIVVPDNYFEQFEGIEKKSDYTIIYARVSSSENKNNLQSQAERLTSFAIASGYKINEIVKECASGLNDTRPKLLKIFKEKKATRLIIEHKDRLTRFGFNYIKELWPECEIINVNESIHKDADLMEDFISIITSFSARIYGNRRSKRKTEQIIKTLEGDTNEGSGEIFNKTD